MSELVKKLCDMARAPVLPEDVDAILWEAAARIEALENILADVKGHIGSCRVQDQWINPEIGHGWESVKDKTDVKSLEAAYQLLEKSGV